MAGAGRQTPARRHRRPTPGGWALRLPALLAACVLFAAGCAAPEDTADPPADARKLVLPTGREFVLSAQDAEFWDSLEPTHSIYAWIAAAGDDGLGALDLIDPNYQSFVERYAKAVGSHRYFAKGKVDGGVPESTLMGMVSFSVAASVLATDSRLPMELRMQVARVPLAGSLQLGTLDTADPNVPVFQEALLLQYARVLSGADEALRDALGYSKEEVEANYQALLDPGDEPDQ